MYVLLRIFGGGILFLFAELQWGDTLILAKEPCEKRRVWEVQCFGDFLDAPVCGFQQEFGFAHQKVREPEVKGLSGFLSDRTHQMLVGNTEFSGIEGGVVFFLAVSVKQIKETVGDFIRTGYFYTSCLVGVKTVHF